MRRRGAAYRGRRKPAIRRRRYARKGKGKTSRLVKTIRKVLNKTLETKYTAFEINDGYVYGNLNHSNGASGAPVRNWLKDIIPPVSQNGANSTSTTRIGTRITPVKCVATVQYYFQGSGIGGTQDLSGVDLSGLYEVRQICVGARNTNSAEYEGLNLQPSTLMQAQLLETGQAYTVAPDSAYPTNLLYPISNEHYKLHPGNKKFIMGKNAGLMSGVDYPLANVRVQDTIRFSVPLPKVLMYDEQQGSNPSFGTKPTNCSALWGAYAGILNNQQAGAGSVTYDGILQTVAISGVPKHPVIRYNLRVELWFKDA